MKVERVLRDSDMFRIFPYKNQVFFFPKPNGNFRSRLDIQTLQPIWTIETLNLKFNDSAFYEKYVIDENGLILDIPQKEVYSLNKIINGYRWNDVKTQCYLLFGTLDEEGKKEVGVFNYEKRQVLWRNPLPIINVGIVSNDFKSFFKAMVSSNTIVDGIISINFLNGSFIWQRSFKELGIANLDKFIGDIDNILVCACGKTILGLDKNTGEIRWKLRHRSEAQYTLLNPSTGCLYQLYGWADSGSNNSLILLEVDAKTGTILYDKSIFEHPNYQPIDNLGPEQDWKYPRFHYAVQWKEKIYFLVNPTGTSWLVNVFEFDCIQKRVTKVSDELYATTNSIFVAEGKLFINSEICKKVTSRDNPENEKWSRAISIPRMDGEKELSEYYAISKESYLTIFDLEDN